MKDTTKPLSGHFLDGFMSHIGAYLYAMIVFCTYPRLTSSEEFCTCSQYTTFCISESAGEPPIGPFSEDDEDESS